MTVEKAPYWTELYYDIIEAYFWEPQWIDRKPNPVTCMMAKLGEQVGKTRDARDHMLDLLFHIIPSLLLGAPGETTDSFLKSDRRFARRHDG